MASVLVVATSRQTRGGITSVVNAHTTGEQWPRFNCRWIETHIDRSVWAKLWWFLRSFVQFLFLLPSADLVHIHTSEPSSLIRKLPFFLWAKIWKKPILIHFHAFSPDTTIRGSWSGLYRFIFAHAARVVVLSNFWKEIINAECPSARTTVVFNPCLGDVIADSSASGRREPFILFAGTVNQRKGYADMIRAFASIASKYPDWHIVFAGNGEIRQGEDLARQLHIEKQTEFLGWVTGSGKDSVFQRASVFCLPSYAEGFPMSVLDAWSYGLPVITTPVGGIPDIAVDGENALLFEPGDVDALAGCMERLIEDTDLRSRLSKQSLLLAQTTFNKEEINKQIGALYEELITDEK